MIRGSMPNLPSEINCSETSDSTESLIDEAEAYLRRGIDSILKISSPDRDCLSGVSSRRRRSRRNSETDVTRKDFLPKNARPFLPKVNMIILFFYYYNNLIFLFAYYFFFIKASSRFKTG